MLDATLDLGDGTHEAVVGGAVPESANARGDLRIEDVRGDPAGQLDEDFDILPGGVEDLSDFGTGEQRKKRRKTEAVGQRIDNSASVLSTPPGWLVGGGCLVSGQSAQVGE